MTQIFEPELRLPVMSGWFVKESHTLLAADGQANVIASSEPLDPTIDVQQYAGEQGRLLRNEFPGYDEYEFREELVFGGRPGYIRIFSWTPPDGVPVTQMQMYYAADGRGYTATATTPSSGFDRYEDSLRAILRDVRIQAVGDA